MSKQMLLLLGLIGVQVVANAGSAAPEKTNIIIVLADDMGYGDLSCLGNKVVKTPALDRLHDASVRFTDFHAAPMCTPSRGQLLTGMDALRNGARWVGTQETNLRTDVPTMAELFRTRGYRTGLFGKWHLGDNYPLRPQDRGFEEAVWFPQASIGDKMGEYWTNSCFDDHYFHNGERRKFKGYSGDIWYDEAIPWMRQCAADRKPFFCYLPNNLLHSPYFVPAKYREAVLKNKQLNANQATFFGMLLNLDENVARLDRFLAESGLKDNTIVIFMSDNGGTQGVPLWNAGMKGGKCTLWEGGHRVPCFIRWPAGQLGAPRDVPGLTQIQDILPTLLDLTRGGANPPGEPQREASLRLDGVSLVPALRESKPVPDRTLVVQYQSKDVIAKDDACVMWRQWRLIGGKELYNVETDPHQDRNVIAQNAEIAARLKAFHDTWWAGVQPDLDKRGRVVVGHDAENPLTLNASGWQGPYIVDNDAVRRGRKTNGVWNLTVAKDGRYQVALRRWPADVDAPIRAATPPVPLTDTFCYGAQTAPGVALDIAKARVKIGDFEAEKPVNDTVTEIVFELPLKAGPVTLQTWFLDGGGTLVAGAYYVRIARE